MNNDEIRDFKVDGKGENENDNKIFTDVKELLQQSQYSGAKNKMKEILKFQEFILGLQNGDLVQRPSLIDTELLKDENMKDFDKDIVN